MNCIGIELIIDDANSELLDHIWLRKIKNWGLLTLINAEHLGEGFTLLGGLTDHDAILNNNDWSQIVELGCDIIQTDWPNFLSEYRKRETGGLHGVSTNTDS